MKYIFDITPIAAPRMTRADRWQHRPIVTKYFNTRNRLRYAAKLKGLDTLPGIIEGITFYLPVPASWSKKKKATMLGQPHQQTPDLDNILKFFKDSLCSEDKHIHSIGQLKKVWAEFGRIELILDDEIVQKSVHNEQEFSVTN